MVSEVATEEDDKEEAVDDTAIDDVDDTVAEVVDDIGVEDLDDMVVVVGEDCCCEHVCCIPLHLS